ncbi:MAG: hypothetical protein JEY91_16035 [Spirochaetaceae bacterium]|nr:hypothetical protein [Spirochaetaceae bacterium]
MNDRREVFLQNQINIYKALIRDMENSNMNQKEKKDLLNIRDLHRKYSDEFESLLIKNQ